MAEEVTEGFQDVLREPRRVLVGWTLLKLFFADRLATGDWQLDFFKTPIPLQFYRFVPPKTHFFYYDRLKTVNTVPNTRRRSGERGLGLPHLDGLRRGAHVGLIRKSGRRNRLSLRNFDIIMDDKPEMSDQSTQNNFVNDRYEILSSSDSEWGDC